MVAQQAGVLPLDAMKGDSMTPIEEAQKAVREWDEGKHCHWDSRAYVDVIRGLLGDARPAAIDPGCVQDIYTSEGVIYVRQHDRLFYLENKKLHPVLR